MNNTMCNYRKSSLILLVAMLCCTGCDGTFFNWGQDKTLVRPTIAVLKFQNSAGSPMGWNLGDGMADILVNRLVATGRYEVMERSELQAIQDEIRLQTGGETRQQNRAARGRIKNVQYLIKGTVTDFNPVSAGRGWAGTGGWNIFGGGNRAVMGMIFSVVEVESGQIICSQRVEGSVRSGDMSSEATYKGVGFGGAQFYQTPLGRATAEAIDNAVRKITDSIATTKWQPRLAYVGEDNTVILNGGKDRGVKKGDYYEVLAAGQPIVNPDNGDVISYRGGRVLGRIQVTLVEPLSAQAAVVLGRSEQFQVGQTCRQIKP